MEKFKNFTAVAAPLKEINIDTDKIIPKQYLKTIQRTGLGKGLFSEMRYNDDGTDNKNFILNQDKYKNSKILVTGDNFGCGSSREHAPWPLIDFGIKCVISTSYADIFYNNCFKNGILPIVLKAEEVEELMKDSQKGENARIMVDLEAQTVHSSDGVEFSFEIDKFKKHCLLEGLDDIGLTMEKVSSIDEFEERYQKQMPWV